MSRKQRANTARKLAVGPVGPTAAQVMSAIASSKPKKSKKPKSSAPPQAVNTSLLKSVCSLTDPFCEDARGAKYPDINQARTLPYSGRALYTLSTDSTGYGSVVLYPALKFAYLPANGGSTAAASYYSAGVEVFTLPQASKYRMVSCGWRLSAASAPLYQQGVVSVRMFSGHTGFLETGIPVQSYNCPMAKDIPLQSVHNTKLISLKTSINATDFTVPTEEQTTYSPDTWLDPEWTWFVVSVVGGPVSSGALSIEFFYNMEVMFDITNAISQLVTPSAPMKPHALSLAQQVSQEVGPIVVEGAKDIGTLLLTTAKRRIKDSLSKSFENAMFP